MGYLEGRIALVTGASRGIGKAIATRFANEGAFVIVAARSVDAPTDIMPGSLAETVAEIQQAGGRASGIGCDIADPASRAALADRVLAEHGRVDILVNNAAIALYGKPYDAPNRMDDLELALEVNLRAPYDFVRRFAPGMIERGYGSVLNLTTATSLIPATGEFPFVDISEGSLVYGASKAALDRLTYGLGAEWLGKGVTANALRPRSAVWTPGVAAYAAEYRNSPSWREEPVEAMAEAALALVTGDPATVTGRVVSSMDYLEEINRPIRTLDGQRIWEAAA